MNNQKVTVIAQTWEESERGWGVRPDGFSLHLTMEDCKKFREAFQEQQLTMLGSAVPDEYSRTSGEPFLAKVELPMRVELIDRAHQESPSRHGRRYYCGEATEPEPLAGPGGYTMFSEPFIVQACDSAEKGFAEKYRKVPTGSGHKGEPFVNHLHAVAACLKEFGFRSEVVAAGYLHDHIEDLPGLWNKSRIAREFGAEVAELVDWVTQQDKSLSWEERTERYADRLRHAPAEAVAISVADKISNLGDLLYWMRQGYPVDSVLKRDWQSNFNTIERLMDIYRGKVPPAMLERLTMLFEEYKSLGS